jgi:hypothetical protein
MDNMKIPWRRRLARWLCRLGIHDLGGAVVSADVCPTCGYSRHEKD